MKRIYNGAVTILVYDNLSTKEHLLYFKHVKYIDITQPFTKRNKDNSNHPSLQKNEVKGDALGLAYSTV